MKAYLKKNSLVKKGLTIFDVLQPTSVLVREPRHIQVIDKYVLAKVWDDVRERERENPSADQLFASIVVQILPMAYGSYVGKLRLVNHYAVDLEHYESELGKLINEYHQ